MLNEAALVLVATLVALALVVLGVIELVWPSRRKRRGRPAGDRRARPETAPPRPGEPGVPGGPLPQEPLTSVREKVVQPPVASGATVAATLRSSRAAPLSDERVSVPFAPAAPAAAAVPAEVSALTSGPAPEQAETPTASHTVPAGPPPLQRCLVLVEQARFQEAIDVGTTALAEERGGLPEARARLWSLVARARRALGDDDGAAAALGSAIAEVPEEEREGYRRELVAFVVTRARELLQQNREATADGDLLVAALRSAHVLLEAGLASAPGDAIVEETLAEVDEAYWPALEARARALLQRDDFGGAHRLALEALADPGLAGSRRDAFEELRVDGLAGQVTTLTADAIASVEEGRDWDAVAALERVDALVKAARGVPAERAEEMTRQLWWALTKLGARRVEAREFEDALDPLFRALRLGGIEPARRDETRWTMLRALEGFVETRATMIREVAADGHRESAAAQAEKLWTMLRSGIAAGVPQERLLSALTTTKQLLEDLGRSV